jgi:hypothetical protein
VTYLGILFWVEGINQEFFDEGEWFQKYQLRIEGR